MARRSRRTYRRRPRRTRKTRRFTMKKSRRTFSKRNKRYHVHNFVRSVEAVYYNNEETGLITTSNDGILPSPGAFTGNFQPYLNGTSWSAALSFSLNRTMGNSDLVSLYDYYKIKGVRITFDYAANTALADMQSVPAPRMICHRDYDDTTFNTWQHYMEASARTYEKRLTNGKFSIFLKPRIKDTIQTDSSGATGSPVAFKRAWLDCNSSTVPHYGMKFAMVDWPFVQPAAGGTTLTARPVLRVKFDYYIAMKGVQ